MALTVKTAMYNNERRGSSQIVPPAPPRYQLVPVMESSSMISSSSSSETDNSGNSRCPFLNNEHLPEMRAVKEQLREYFRRRNRMEQFLRRPWVFLLQFLKLCVITAMLITVKDNSYAIKVAVREMKEALSILLVKDFDAAAPNRRIYSFRELNATTTYALQNYVCLSDMSAISLLGYPTGLKPAKTPDVNITIRHYAMVNISNDWQVDMNDTELFHFTNISCSLCDATNCIDEHRDILSAKDYHTGLLRYTMVFPLQALLVGYFSKPHCVHLEYNLIFTNTLETGMEIEMHLHYNFDECHTSQRNGPGFNTRTSYYLYIAIDVAVMLICALSSAVVIKKQAVAYSIYRRTRLLVEKCYQRKLNRREKHLFVNYWYICILMADILLMAAALLKFFIDTAFLYDLDYCSLLLGGGVWLSYLGVLRYLVFDKHYSMLLNTIVVALPHLGRFMLCVVIISVAFVLCGWLILSPYCTKFATFWVTMETLFSLLNGDDMFATFSLVQTHDYVISQRIIDIFSRIYLYSYVCFFIYVVLSLCISIIEDAYMVVSNYKSDNCPWIQDATVFQEFATCWEQNIRQRRGSTRSRRSGTKLSRSHSQCNCK